MSTHQSEDFDPIWLIQKEKFMTNKGGRFTPNAIQIHVHSSCGYMHSFRHSNLIGYFRSTVNMQSDPKQSGVHMHWCVYLKEQSGVKNDE